MEFYKISVRDIKALGLLLKEKYRFDLSGFMTIPLRKKIVELYEYTGVKDFEAFRLIIEKKDLKESELHSIFQFTNTEMFRDPSLWRFLHSYLMKKSFTRLRVWFPLCVEGYDLYSFFILLKILNLDSITEITISNPNKEVVQPLLKKITLPRKIYEISSANFRRLNLKGGFSLDSFFREEGEEYIMLNNFNGKLNVVESVEENAPSLLQNFIFYRNKMLYYNLSKSAGVLRTLVNSMALDGLIFLGLNEQIRYYKEEFGLSLLSGENSVYQKKK
jgi:chemotaxis protein methyltransferase CheR